MRLLTVRHVTVYRYSEPVRFGEHRMMFRPRESHDLRLVSAKLEILPRPSDLRWLHDPFDNSVAIAAFDEAACELRFDSTVTLEHIETALPHYALDLGAHLYPFRYSDDEQPDLVRALTRHYPGDDLGSWTARFLRTSGQIEGPPEPLFHEAEISILGHHILGRFDREIVESVFHL